MIIIIAQGGVQVRVNTCMLITLQKAHCYISFDEFVACKNCKIPLFGLLLYCVKNYLGVCFLGTFTISMKGLTYITFLMNQFLFIAEPSVVRSSMFLPDLLLMNMHFFYRNVT